MRCCVCVQVVPDKIGEKGTSYNDFICALPDNQCRYAGASGSRSKTLVGGGQAVCAMHNHLCQHCLAPSRLGCTQHGRARPSRLLHCHHPLCLVLLLVLPAVYDYEYTSPERGTFKKLVFLLW